MENARPGLNLHTLEICGFTNTALNNFNGTPSLEQGAREPVRLALIGEDNPTGAFSDREGPVA
ncbi:MAG: hypothetical protein EOO77_34825 [Oxalobacteraceae bacterium]|nr:MAG: hypothetical protein EOO77_34825 [Oxalobacteraceae bacterium]